jgi:hypothetical protein
MPKGSIRNPGTKKTTAARRRKRKELVAAEWDQYRGAGYFGRESNRGMQYTPKLPKLKSFKHPVGKAGQ